MRALVVVFLLAEIALAQGALREASDREADGQKVAKILFVHRGEQLIKNQTLRSAMRIREDGRFRRRFFKSDLGAVVNLYRGRGYRDAEVVRKSLYLDAKDRVHIRIEIDSGALWRVRTVQVEGGDPFASDILRDQLGLSLGEDLIVALVQTGIQDTAHVGLLRRPNSLCHHAENASIVEISLTV